MNMSMIGEKLTLAKLQEIYAAGWVDGYVSEDVSHFGVNRRIDGDFVRWMTRIPEPPFKLLPWRIDRPLYDENNPDISNLFRTRGDS